MPGSAAKVIVSERQQAILKKLSSANTAALRLVQRASIILLAFEGRANQDIAAEVGIGPDQVGVWRRRWKQNFDRLVRIECTEGTPALRKAIEGLLADLPRPGCPGKFTAEQLTQLLALACEPPERSGRPITHWTGRELADELVKRGIVESISVTRVNRYLRQAELQPHKSRYWLNTTEKDPVQFQAQVETVCACYQEAPRLYQECDTHTICVDEMTGIQALERIAPTQPMRPGQAERREFEYVRHGTVTLIGNFHVATGEILAPTLSPTRTEEDFVAHIRQTVEQSPESSYIFVADNLNIHCSAGLVELVAELCDIEGDLGEKGKKGLCGR